MALISSAQSGSWNQPTTWVGGSIPNLSLDDVVVADHHTVTADGGSRTLAGGRQITVSPQGMLEIRSSLTVQPGAALHALGTLAVRDASALSILGQMILDGTLHVQGASTVYIEPGGTLAIDGYASVEFYSTFLVGGTMRVGSLGALEILGSGMMGFDGQSRTDLLGSFRLFPDAYLYLGPDALVRVASSMDISGQMDSDGGRFVILRRESRINDADGDCLFVFDQAYGQEPRPIA